MAVVRRQSAKKSKVTTRRSSKVLKSATKGGRTKRSGIKVIYKDRGEPGDIELIDLIATENKTYYAPAGKAFASVKIDIKEFVAPEVTLTITPSTVMYDKDVDTLGEVAITANVTKGTNDISTVRFAINGTTVKELTEGVEAGGVFLYTHTFNPRTNTSFTINVTVFDSKAKTGASSKEIKFVNKSYYGTVDSTVVNPTAEQITALEHALVGTKAYVYSGINMDYGKVVYAYPAAFGSLTRIFDPIHQLTYTESFTKTSVSIDGTSYFVYTLTDSAAAEDVQLTFE